MALVEDNKRREKQRAAGDLLRADRARLGKENLPRQEEKSVMEGAAAASGHAEGAAQQRKPEDDTANPARSPLTRHWTLPAMKRREPLSLPVTMS